uniref:Uncharacterized protein n=1 Tax=Oryza nivara TaxID=4536 RepID=A0A0E0HEZ4_ORYNI
MFSCLHPRRPGAGRPLPTSTPPDNLHPCRPPLHRVQLLRYLHARGEMTPTAENSMPPSLKPRRQASMSAPRPSAGAATVCCGWYPSITVRRSSRSAITVVPWCAHGQHTNCLMKCMIEVYRYLWIERVTGSSFEVGLDDLKLSGNNDQILQKKTLEDSIIGTC